MRQITKRIIKLNGTSNRLKTCIKDFGDLWEWPRLVPVSNIANEPRGMSCFQGQLGILIVSLVGKHVRNVKMTDIEIGKKDNE